MTLQDALYKFHGAQKGEELTSHFKELAPYFLYKGYYKIGNDYQIYIRTVEFYFHAEKGSIWKEKDPIVYHRNDKFAEGEIPYIPFMALHAHQSGFDITFENVDEKYRASALIRAYEVFDLKNRYFLKYNTTKGLFIKCEEMNQFNTQSSYLYCFLNGFNKDNIVWCNEDRKQNIDLLQKRRKGVFKTIDEETYKPLLDSGNHKVNDEREWSFTRQEDIEISKQKL